MKLDKEENKAYEKGFDIVTGAVLNKEHNYSISLEKSLKIAMDYMGANSIALYRRDNNNPEIFNRFSFACNESYEEYSGISDSCIVNYVSRVDRNYSNTNFDINFPNKKTRIDILPIKTQDKFNYIIVIAGNDLEKPQLFNDIIQRSLEAVLTNMDLLDEIEQARVTDSLTGIKNREGYNLKISELFKNGSPQKLTYTIADLFRLKTVNDQIGHIAGDDYIKSCAEALHAYFKGRDGNHIYRIGGDEFVILSEQYDKETVNNLIKKSNIILRKHMHKYKEKNPNMDFAVNHGSAELSPEVNTLQALYKAADTELAKSKSKIYLESGYDRRR